MAPACVAACPEGAIAIEIVNVAEWRSDYLERECARSAFGAMIAFRRRASRFPTNLPPDTGRVDTQRIVPEHPHWPLVFMLVLTQLSAGAFAALWVMDLLGRAASTFATVLGSLALAGISLNAATLHLGRPIHAWRALKGLRRSWLSREVLGLSLFAGAAGAFAGALFLHLPGRSAVGFATVLLRVRGIDVLGADLYGSGAAGVEQPLYHRRIFLHRAAAGADVRLDAEFQRRGPGVGGARRRCGRRGATAHHRA